MMDENAAVGLVQKILQDVGYKLSDLLQGYPQRLHVFVLVAMQGVVNSVLPMLNDLDRQVFERLVEHTTIAVLPSEMDPRRKGEQT